MKRWVLLFISDKQYYKFTLETIRQARTVGGWKESIVVCIPELNSQWEERAEQWDFKLRLLPKRDLSSIQEKWKSVEDSYEKGYLAERPNIWNKFFIFDPFFKQWDVVFYMDSGCCIQHPLERFKISCEPHNCLYAHSNSYPSYEWGLKEEFVWDMMPSEDCNQLKEKYNVYCDYFQTTIMLFDTQLIQENTVETLFRLAETYVSRHDQGIINLYFLYTLAAWKQIPLRDEQGFLYDFHERDGHPQGDYALLKYPLKRMRNT